MKFNGITENEAGEPMTICIEDFKVNRGNSLTKKEARKKIYVPVITPLKKLLYELGYNENKGKDMYILAPTETMERRTMMDFISKSFSFYYKKLNTGKDLTFYDLRKTYISHLLSIPMKLNHPFRASYTTFPRHIEPPIPRMLNHPFSLQFLPLFFCDSRSKN